MKIRKAIFPVAGFGTRFLPATKAIPKEMLTIVDRPVIQYAVDEAIQAGCDTLIFVTGRSKRAIEDYFDSSPELERELTEKGNLLALEALRSIIAPHVKCIYLRQAKPLGLGHAVLCAESLINDDEHFAVMLPDDVIDGHGQGTLCQMLAQWPTEAQGMIAVEPVCAEDVSKYGILEIDGDSDRALLPIKSLVEKPLAKVAPSNMAVVGRYILNRDVLRILHNQAPGAHCEIQLTDALATYARTSPMYGFRYQGNRFDCGSRAGFHQANLHYWAKTLSEKP